MSALVFNLARARLALGGGDPGGEQGARCIAGGVVGDREAERE